MSTTIAIEREELLRMVVAKSPLRSKPLNERNRLLVTVIMSSMKFASNILVCCLLACFVCSAQISSPDQVFSKIVPALLRKTSVPPRLPTDLPGLGKGDFHAIINSVDETGYVIILSTTPDCEGQHVCSYAALIGTTHPLKEFDFYAIPDRKSVSVRLHNGIVGDFYNTICAAYCSDSLMVWTEGRYHYIIGLKAESKPNVIRAANSAIDAADRWK